MISISDGALALIRSQGDAVHLDLPPESRGGCCVAIQECPEVRRGPPRDPRDYVEQSSRGVRVWVPKRMVPERDYTIVACSLLGFRWLALEGWSPL